MTIDEAINNYIKLKIFAEVTDDKRAKEEYEQLVEWLEELKSYRASVFSGDMTQKMLKEEYNKAIDDFIHECDKCCGFYTGNNKNLTREDMLNIAEQLKAGGENESK